MSIVTQIQAFLRENRQLTSSISSPNEAFCTDFGVQADAPPMWQDKIFAQLSRENTQIL